MSVDDFRDMEDVLICKNHLLQIFNIIIDPRQHATGELVSCRDVICQYTCWILHNFNSPSSLLLLYIIFTFEDHIDKKGSKPQNCIKWHYRHNLVNFAYKDTELKEDQLLRNSELNISLTGMKKASQTLNLLLWKMSKTLLISFSSVVFNLNNFNK